ncbi:MAG: MBOAT family O-acyltransferase [Clostridia bacterium]
MLFSSIPFLFYFLPIVVALYFIMPNIRWKNIVLMLASLFFYFWGEPIYTLLMLFTITSGFVHGLFIEKFSNHVEGEKRQTKKSKAFMLSSVIISLALLGVFKYTDFFIETINGVFNAGLDPLRLALPIGISFYTFQTLSYTIDLYRGNAKMQKSYVNFATYVALFPQLIAGPIVRYTTIADQLDNREHKLEYVSKGTSRFIIGLAKKVLIANLLGELCSVFRASSDKSVLFYWLYVISYSLHLYFDFSGYSDMAIGLGKIFGFDFLENFNYPFISRSATDFWRRWHISLGTWFRDYVYIPMGGSRVPMWRWIINIAVVWFLTGFWHGAGWTFIAWGLMFGFLLVIEKLFLNKLLDKLPRFVSHIYTLLMVLISFALFDATNISSAFGVIGGMFGIGTPLVSQSALYYLGSYSLILIMAIIGATPLPKMIVTKVIGSGEKAKSVMNVLEIVYIFVLFILIVAYLIDGSFNPFLYFRF